MLIINTHSSKFMIQTFYKHNTFDPKCSSILTFTHILITSNIYNLI